MHSVAFEIKVYVLLWSFAGEGAKELGVTRSEAQ